METARDAGYQTAGFGKTHWGVVCSTRGFGRVLKKLKQKGVLDNAIMVYCSDHGEASRYMANDVIGGEFYNLDEDPQEWDDLYSDPTAPREIRDKMTKELLEFLKSQHRLTGSGHSKG
jgi:hypothetical protein